MNIGFKKYNPKTKMFVGHKAYQFTLFIESHLNKKETKQVLYYALHYHGAFDGKKIVIR